MEIAPFGWAIDPAICERAAFGGPSGKGSLRIFDFFAVHAVEEIIGRIEFADMIEAQPAVATRPVEIRWHGVGVGRAEFARLAATGMRAHSAAIADATVKAVGGSFVTHLRLHNVCVPIANSHVGLPGQLN